MWSDQDWIQTASSNPFSGISTLGWFINATQSGHSGCSYWVSKHLFVSLTMWHTTTMTNPERQKCVCAVEEVWKTSQTATVCRSTLKHAVCSATCNCLESETIDQSCVVRVQIYWRLRLHQSNQCRCDLITHRSERLCLSHPIWGTNWILLLTEHQLRSSYSYNQSNVSDLQTAVLKPNRPNQLLINHTDMRVLLTSEWQYHTKCLYIPLK